MNKSPATGATETVDSEIAERILNALIVRGLSQQTLAQEIGISHSTLRRSLDQSRGDRRSFSILELTKIAGALNVKTSILMPTALTHAA